MLGPDIWRTLLLFDTQVTVQVLADVKVGDRLLRKGEKVPLSLREALPLLRKGVVAVDAAGLPTQTDVNKAVFMERQAMKDGSPLPVPLPYDFYARARLSLLLEKDERSIRATQTMLIDLIRLRLQKILKAVTASPEPNRDLMERLTMEERALYAHLCKSVSDWYATMKHLIENGNPLT